MPKILFHQRRISMQTKRIATEASTLSVMFIVFKENRMLSSVSTVDKDCTNGTSRTNPGASMRDGHLTVPFCSTLKDQSLFA